MKLPLAPLLSLPLFAATASAGSGQDPPLPPEYRWGRCLLQVAGRTYISGRCAYHIGRSGSFEIHGPRQTYAGIHYPEPPLFADHVSTDWFAQVDVERGTGNGFWNRNIKATHAHGRLGRLIRKGACWSNAQAKVCLWKR